MVIAALVLGLAAGAAIIFVALLLTYRDGAFNAKGILALGVGLALIGMPFWSRIRIGPSGIELDRLQQQVHDLAAGTSAVAEQVEDLAVNVEGTRGQLLSVTHALRESPRLDPAMFAPIEDSLTVLPTFDLRAFREATATIERTERALRPRPESEDP